MSSYLTFYVIPKEGEVEKEPISLVSFSRSNEIYSRFNDTLNIAYIGIEDGPRYTELDEDMVSRVIKDLDEEINTISKKLSEYEKYAAGNLDIVDEIISYKEYLSELQAVKHHIEFVLFMVGDSKICCNID